MTFLTLVKWLLVFLTGWIACDFFWMVVRHDDDAADHFRRDAIVGNIRAYLSFAWKAALVLVALVFVASLSGCTVASNAVKALDKPIASAFTEQGESTEPPASAPAVVEPTPAGPEATEAEEPAKAPEPVAEPSVTTPTLTGGEFELAWPEDKDIVQWYRSPFTETTDSLSDKGTLETIAEPGVLLDNTAAYDHMSATETPVLVPEAGYAYIAIGATSLTHNGAKLNLDHMDRNIYLIILRGLPSDGGDADLNQVVMASDYIRATGIYSPMPSGAYVSLGWFTQQILASYKSPNCGGEGCRTVTAVLVDLQTHTYRMWTVDGPKSPRQWVRAAK